MVRDSRWPGRPGPGAAAGSQLEPPLKWPASMVPPGSIRLRLGVGRWAARPGSVTARFSDMDALVTHSGRMITMAQ
jgi:hypothetical protein